MSYLVKLDGKFRTEVTMLFLMHVLELESEQSS